MPSPTTNLTCTFYAPTNAELRGYAEVLESDGTLDYSIVMTDPQELLEELGERPTDLLVADLGRDPDGVLDVIEKLPTPRPRLIVVGPQDRSGPILRAMRMGVREYFDETPSEDDLRRAIRRVSAEIGPDPVPLKHARMIAVMGAKGGVGATVVACQLAATLQAGGARTAVVDLNMPLGDVALYFDIQPAYTLANIAREVEGLDMTYLRTLLQGRADGVQILAAPTLYEEAELVRGPHVDRVLNLLRGDFDWVILDLSRNWNESNVRALEMADQILLVTLLDVPTLHHTRRHLDLLERLGHSGSRVRVIANRCSALDAVGEKDVREFLDREPAFQIPNDFPTTLAGVNRGVPVAEIAPRSPLARAYVGFAEALHEWCDADRPAPQPATGGGFARAVRGMFRRN